MIRVPLPGLSVAAWRKSSHSNQEGGDCVEISDGFPAVVPVRDSKCPNGPWLMISNRSFGAFVSAVSHDQLSV